MDNSKTNKTHQFYFCITSMILLLVYLSPWIINLTEAYVSINTYGIFVPVGYDITIVLPMSLGGRVSIIIFLVSLFFGLTSLMFDTISKKATVIYFSLCIVFLCFALTLRDAVLSIYM